MKPPAINLQKILPKCSTRQKGQEFAAPGHWIGVFYKPPVTTSPFPRQRQTLPTPPTHGRCSSHFPPLLKEAGQSGLSLLALVHSSLGRRRALSRGEGSYL